MFQELLDETKKDILTQVKDNINQIYSDFEMVRLDNEVADMHCVKPLTDEQIFYDKFFL